MVGQPCPTPNKLKDYRFERTPNYEPARGAHMSLAYPADHSPPSSAEIANGLEKYLCLPMYVNGVTFTFTRIGGSFWPTTRILIIM